MAMRGLKILKKEFKKAVKYYIFDDVEAFDRELALLVAKLGNDIDRIIKEIRELRKSG